MKYSFCETKDCKMLLIVFMSLDFSFANAICTKPPFSVGNFAYKFSQLLLQTKASFPEHHSFLLLLFFYRL